MSKQEQSVITLLENMEKSLDKKDEIIKELFAEIEIKNSQIKLLEQI